MKRLINLTILLWYCCYMVSAGIVDSPELRKSREKSKSSSLNSIIAADANEKPVNEFQPLKITHEDVVKGSNSVYSSQSQFSNGGIIFAITGQSSLAPQLMSAAPQPVLLQYLSPEGMPKQSAVQYVQLLRPLMMVPAQSYHALRSMSTTTMPIETATTTMDTKLQSIQINPYGPFLKTSNTLVGAQSAPLLSFFNSNPRPLTTPTVQASNIGLNTNEYIPSASSRIVTSVIPPQVPNISMTAFKPSSYPIMAQRA
ncbi:hypothetical protein PVAND_010267 [Polypedilum vanderplanki]|uniref:Uncharacterized protein n=1 Tax=Polypedilum vanderplanki TaxID=319348 RepID=A0A9J6CFS0_POLVA|nr:hypothetical protein PVAND_010267 [Polypedilum vanderplanki]